MHINTYTYIYTHIYNILYIIFVQEFNFYNIFFSFNLFFYAYHTATIYNKKVIANIRIWMNIDNKCYALYTVNLEEVLEEFYLKEWNGV